MPPAAGSIDNSCFCDYDTLAPWHQAAVGGVCPNAPCAPDEFTSLQSWFTSYCSSATAAADGNGDAGGATTTTNTNGAPSSTNTRNQANQGPGGDW